MALPAAPGSDTEQGEVHSAFEAPAGVVVALLIVLRECCPQWKQWPKIDVLLKLTGAGRSQAYEYAKVLRDLLPGLKKSAGRPAAPPPSDHQRQLLSRVLQAYMRSHPGAVCNTGARTVYSDNFRRFVVQLIEPGQAGEGLSIADLAEATGVPLGTLKAWVSLSPRTEVPSASPSAPPPASSVLDTVRGTHQGLIVTLWPSWEGSFQAFCEMLRTEHRLRYGDTYIGSLLEAVGVRPRKRRQPVEAPWSSGTFQTFFPGAQWLGDGTSLPIRWGNDVFVFNVEALHDPASDATVGFAVTDAEGEEALRLAYLAGLETTTGQPPYALTLDNKGCNHSPGAEAATPGTVLLHATLGRGQAKAPVEGAFGLFEQTMPSLVVVGATPREMANEAVSLVLTAWHRGRNGRPRARLGGKTPIETYTRHRVSPEEIASIRAFISEQQRRYLAAQQTRAARRDPVRIELLKRGLVELTIADPDERLTRSLAYYSQEAIARGLATFRAKQELGTVPADAEPGRYLGGIIRQLDTRIELERVSSHLLEQRIRLRDLTLAPLHRAAAAMRQQLIGVDQPAAFVDRALEATVEVDVRFWGSAAAEAIGGLDPAARNTLYPVLCRRIAASFGTDRVRRADLIDRLAAAITRTVPDTRTIEQPGPGQTTPAGLQRGAPLRHTAPHITPVVARGGRGP